MRILFATTPGAGHVQPLLGLALAARARGHHVAWATATDAWPLLHAHGIHTLEAGVPFAQAFAEYRRRWPEGAAVAPRSQAEHGFPRLFGCCIAEAMLPALHRAVVSWRPDLVVNEPGALASPLAAEAHGVRHLTHAFGLPMPDSIVVEASAAMAPAWRAAGLEVPRAAGLFEQGAIEIAPSALLEACGNPVRAQQVLAQRPAAVNGAPSARLPATLAEFVERAAGRQLVYASFGTLHQGGPAFALLIQALADAGAHAVVTTAGRGSLAAPDAAQGNLWLGDYVPQELILPHCAAVISHGGAGTSLAAMAAGLPQLCLPQGADQFRNADALAACGAAIVLEAGSRGEGLDPARIAGAVRELLGHAGLRRGALRLWRQVDAMPTPEDTAAALERL